MDAKENWWKNLVKKIKSREHHEEVQKKLSEVLKKNGLIPLYKDVFPEDAQKYRK